MPFTPSHAVVALPFARTALIPAAIAIGAMTPDLPLFIRTGLPAYSWTHSLPWLPATVVLAFGLLVLWRCVLRPAAGELSPTWLAARLPVAWSASPTASLRETMTGGASRISFRSLLLLAASLLIGALSHIVWDLFTHEGRWGVEAIPLLGVAWGPVPGYSWIQHGSSLLGLLVLAIWAGVQLRRQRATVPTRKLPSVVRVTWWVSLPATLVIASAAGLLAYGPLTEEWTVQHVAYRVLPLACGLWGAGTVVLAAVVTLVTSRSAPGGGSRGRATPTSKPRHARDAP